MSSHRSWGVEELKAPFAKRLCLYLLFLFLVFPFSLVSKASASNLFGNLLRSSSTLPLVLLRSIVPESNAGSPHLIAINTSTELGPIQQRVDLTKLPFLTIDPENANELDDAIYVEDISPQLRQVKVAIADPLSILTTAEDQILEKAMQQMFTKYGKHSIKPLFPKSITEKTSLNQGQRRPAVVVDYIVNIKGQIVEKPEVYLATINSVAQLSYEQVNAYKQGQSTFSTNLEELVDRISETSLVLKNNRLNQKKRVISGEDTVAEFMLQTNTIIANHMLGLGITAPYRVQEDENKQAYYTTKPFKHASLGVYYTHFTSPLRRFPDCLVHAALFYPNFLMRLKSIRQFKGPVNELIEDLCVVANNLN